MLNYSVFEILLRIIVVESELRLKQVNYEFF